MFAHHAVIVEGVFMAAGERGLPLPLAGEKTPLSPLCNGIPVILPGIGSVG